MADPLVSIIIPCYNAELWIDRSVHSAVQQTYRKIEVIVVDDGSKDNSASIVKKIGGRVKLCSVSNRGACAARNHGLRIAQGDYIQFLDADDMISAGKIEMQINSLRRSPPNSVATCSWTHVAGNDVLCPPNPKSFWKDYSRGIDLLIETWSVGGFFPSHSWLVPRSIIRATGWWNESLAADQDGEFFGRVLATCGPVVFVPGAFAYYRIPGRGNVSSSVSANALSSRALATETVSQAIRRAGGNLSSSKAVSIRWQSLAYYFSHYDMSLALEAASQAYSASPTSFSVQAGGKWFRRLARMIGFRRALKVRRAVQMSRLKRPKVRTRGESASKHE